MNEKIEKALKDVQEKTENAIVKVSLFMQKHPVIASAISTTAGALVTGAIAYTVGRNNGRDEGVRKTMTMYTQPLRDEKINSVTMYTKKGDKVWTVTGDTYKETPNDISVICDAAGLFKLKPAECMYISRVGDELLIRK